MNLGAPHAHFIERPVKFTVYGQLWSMKNGKIARKGGFPVKNAKTRQFETDFLLQVPSRFRVLGLGSAREPLRAIVTVFYPSFRQDLDTALLYDLLQKAGVVSNDRWIREHHEFACVDPQNPRCEIILEVI